MSVDASPLRALGFDLDRTLHARDLAADAILFVVDDSKLDVEGARAGQAMSFNA